MEASGVSAGEAEEPEGDSGSEEGIAYIVLWDCKDCSLRFVGSRD